jgi:uncharacterized cofD-like protein
MNQTDLSNVPSEEERRLVAIGGGAGISKLLIGARPYFRTRTAVVAVTDSGRSTGLARALVDMPAPGDLRNMLASLADNPQALFPRLLQYRFDSPNEPAYDGMAFGNLLIAALTQMEGDFASAIETVASLVNSSERVLPASTANTHLCAELEDGSTMQGELEVRGLNKAPIHRLFLADSNARAYPPAIEAITHADMVVLGPGSFFTSVLASLLFHGMADALRASSAVVAFVCNTTTQPGQTDRYGAFDHVQRIVEMLGPGVLDVVLINRSDELDPSLLAQYASAGLYLIRPYDDEIARIADLGVEPIIKDYVQNLAARRSLWKKQDSIRHDPSLLVHTLWEVLQTHDHHDSHDPTRNAGSPGASPTHHD